MSESNISDKNNARKRSKEFEDLADGLQEIRKQLRGGSPFSRESLEDLKKIAEKIEEIEYRISLLQRWIEKLESFPSDPSDEADSPVKRPK